MLPFIPSGNELVNGGIILIIFGAILTYFRRLPDKIMGIIERYFITRLEIQDNDESFYWIKIWLAQKLNNTLSISVYTRRKKRNLDDDAAPPNESKDKPNIVFVPAPGIYWTRYKNHLMIVNADRSETSVGTGNTSVTKMQESFTIRLFTRNRDLARQIIEEARDQALPNDGYIDIRSAQHDYWSYTSRVRPRSLDSVILNENKVDFLLNDIKNFLKSADWYNKLGIPYRRGYLLYGSPGNGKSSIVLAVASELNMTISLLNLSNCTINDSSLNGLLGNCSENSIILMEDVDCAFVKREKKDKMSSLTFSGVLNSLDGIAAHEGQIIFMTTNHIEKLDSALIRPGRTDVKLFIGNAVKDQIYRLFKRFYDGTSDDLALDFSNKIPDGAVNMASLQGHLMKYKDCPDKAIEFVEQIQLQK